MLKGAALSPVEKPPAVETVVGVNAHAVGAADAVPGISSPTAAMTGTTAAVSIRRLLRTRIMLLPTRRPGPGRAEPTQLTSPQQRDVDDPVNVR